MEWIHNFIKPLLAGGILIAPLLSIVIPVAWIKKRNKRFKNPLTQNMRRPAGTELARHLSNERDELDLPLFFLALVTPFLIAYYFILVYWFSVTDSLLVKTFLVGLWLLTVSYYTRDFIKRVYKIRNLRLGYECELAVGQELDQLMLHGFRVFHDIPAGDFNIDHIVVGRTGVFAIETKGRSKRKDPKTGKVDKSGYTVQFDGKALHFADRLETQPIRQAYQQAKWVSAWLTKATALPVTAKPVLILPGWFIVRSRKSQVAVLPGKQIENYFLKQRHLFNDDEVQRIAYQIDQKTRDLAPGEILDLPG